MVAAGKPEVQGAGRYGDSVRLLGFMFGVTGVTGTSKCDGRIASAVFWLAC